MKIVLLGDSLTWVGYGGSYFTELVPLLPDHTLINAGVGGNTVINLLRRFETDVLPHAPDAVFILIGGNDAVSFSQPGTRSYYRQGQGIDEGVVTPEAFETAYRDLLTQIQAHHILPLIGLEPNEYNPKTVATLQDYNDRIKRLALSMSIPVLDLMAQFPPTDVPDRPDLDVSFILTIGAREKRGWTDYEDARAKGGFSFTFDGLHLMPDTATQVAQLIADFIRAHVS